MTYEEELVLAAKVVRRYYNNEVKVVDLDDYPEDEDLIDLWELDTDISQGTGNVIIRHEYDPKTDVVYRYADF